MTCQQISENDQLWANASEGCRRQWNTCLRSLQELEEKLSLERLKRQKWARYLKFFGMLLAIVQNVISGIAAGLPFVITTLPDAALKGINVIVFIFSMALWSRMGEKAHQHLVVASDLNKAERFAASVRKMLRDVASDGVITADQRVRIVNAMGAIGKMGDSFGPMADMTRILGDDADKETRLAIGEIGQVVEMMNRDASRFNQQYPAAMREYAENRNRILLHSQSRPPLAQMQEHIPPV